MFSDIKHKQIGQMNDSFDQLLNEINSLSSH